MNSNTQRAKKLLEENGYTCVILNDDTVFSSEERGVKPLVKWVEQRADFHGFCAADKIVGKAAAFLYIILGVEEVYASVMSEDAVHTLASHGVTAMCDTMVKKIINRKGDGMCPMEEAVKDITIPDEGFIAIKNKIKILMANK